ncbi:winged helix-turn-helix domain-containing protein [Rhodoflexus sp.]
MRRATNATVYRYATVYQNAGVEDYLKENWVPYAGKLTEEQRKAIYEEVSSRLYASARAVAAWIAYKFGIHYHEKHVVKLSHNLGFRYKKTQVVPAKLMQQPNRHT